MDKQNKIPDDIKLLYKLAAGFILLAALITGAHGIKKSQQPTVAEYTPEHRSLEERLNKSIADLLFRTEKRIPELYAPISNYIIDTAWSIQNKEAKAVYYTLMNKRNALVTGPAPENITKEEDEKVVEEIRRLTQQMNDIKEKYKVFYGWTIRHKCILNGEQTELIIESDSTGRKVKEIYADAVNYKACKDSTELQNMLKTKQK